MWSSPTSWSTPSSRPFSTSPAGSRSPASSIWRSASRRGAAPSRRSRRRSHRRRAAAVRARSRWRPNKQAAAGPAEWECAGAGARAGRLPWAHGWLLSRACAQRRGLLYSDRLQRRRADAGPPFVLPGETHGRLVHAQRQADLPRRRSGHALAVGDPRCRRPDRHQIRLRHRAMRRLHRAYRRAGNTLLRDAGLRRRRPERDDHRGAVEQAGQGGADRMAQARRRAMRLLPVRPDHVGDGAAHRQRQAQRPRHRQRDERQYLPLRDLCPHPRRHPRGGPRHGGLIMARSLARTNRRRFLQGAAAATAGLTIGFHWTGVPRVAAAAAADGMLAPNAFVRVAPDNSVTLMIKHVEMGQGTYTGLATVVAEELDPDWAQVRAEAAPADASRYNNLLFGKIQGTGGSTAMANSWDQLRQAGATARAMLVAAAAAEWGVPAGEITVERGGLKHAASGRSAKFGALAAKAAAQPVPANVAVKDAKDFHLIGQRLPRPDTPAKTDGTAQFAIDVRLPDMVVAVVQRPLLFGATVRSPDATAARAVPRVVDVVQIPAGVAGVGKNLWAAKQGGDALRVEWDD